MVRIIMHGCNGHMGQVISGLVEQDPEAEIVAGIDIADQGKNSYPVFTDMKECQVEADAIIDFSSAKAVDALLDYSAQRQIPVVVCTTGLSEEQLAKIEETSKKVAVLKSANMALGINTLMKLIQDAARVLATAGFDMLLKMMMAVATPMMTNIRHGPIASFHFMASAMIGGITQQM